MTPDQVGSYELRRTELCSVKTRVTVMAVRTLRKEKSGLQPWETVILAKRPGFLVDPRGTDVARTWHGAMCYNTCFGFNEGHGDQGVNGFSYPFRRATLLYRSRSWSVAANM